MTTIKFKELECEASIDGADIVLFSIAKGCGREFLLKGAACELERAVDAEADAQRHGPSEWASFRDDEDSRDQVRENLIESVVSNWKGEVVEVTEHLN